MINALTPAPRELRPLAPRERSAFRPERDTFEVWEKPTDIPPPAPARPRWPRLARIGAVVGLSLALGLGLLAAGQPAAMPQAPPPVAAVVSQPVSAQSAPITSYEAVSPTGAFAIEAYGHYGAFQGEMLSQIPRYVTYPPNALVTLMYYQTQRGADPHSLAVPAGHNYFNLPVSTPLSNFVWSGPSQDGLRVYGSAMESIGDFVSVLQSKSFEQSGLLNAATTDQDFFRALRQIGYLSPAQYRDVTALHQSQWGN